MWWEFGGCGCSCSCGCNVRGGGGINSGASVIGSGIMMGKPANEVD